MSLECNIVIASEVLRSCSGYMFVKSCLFLACAAVPPKRSGRVPVISFEMHVYVCPDDRHWDRHRKRMQAPRSMYAPRSM